MKLCVLITGTNAVGKSTLAEELIAQFGGRKEIGEELTLLADSRVCLAGPYKIGNRYGGVDMFKCTRVLPHIVEAGLEAHDVVICEGMYLHTFGLNLAKALFKAEKQLVVFLHAPRPVIVERILNRSGASGRAGSGTSFDKVFDKQMAAYKAAQRWASIGVPVMDFDTSKVDVTEIRDELYKRIAELCGWSMTTRS